MASFIPLKLPRKLLVALCRQELFCSFLFLLLFYKSLKLDLGNVTVQAAEHQTRSKELLNCNPSSGTDLIRGLMQVT